MVVHHAAQAYGPADWWYVEGRPRAQTLGMLSAVDGAFLIQNLLAYSLLYVLCSKAVRLVRRRSRGGGATRVPGHAALLWLTAGIAAATFLVRLRYPLDEWVPVLDFLQVEPARVPQYAAFFTLGVLAHRHGWLERFDARIGRA
ncbi:hypothetical protein [Streptomyces sp. S.PB5]|uniref:hypothetical protein n=1 Tax=Streptomyces sp. S.PB5 TaxID=3020844 RepID=UPI0025B0A12F|nr:hypothetical protein [Streptomyces sp. S.PB5]MDN3027230.1 hypothetical protein [Streptomyces sp. S.PB5]